MNKSLHIAFSIVVLTILAGCGAKGPLILPEKAEPIEEPTETAPETMPESTAPAAPTDSTEPVTVPTDAPTDGATETTPPPKDD